MEKWITIRVDIVSPKNSCLHVPLISFDLCKLPQLRGEICKVAWGMLQVARLSDRTVNARGSKVPRRKDHKQSNPRRRRNVVIGGLFGGHCRRGGKPHLALISIE